MRDLLVTGTDTGVGKTVIAAALVKVLRAAGVRAIGFKPAETGVNGIDVPDSEVLRNASGERTPLAEPLMRFVEPLAPAVAAERAGTPIRSDAIERRVAQLREVGYTVVIEGAGGVMVPLVWEEGAVGRPSYTVLDLAAHCGAEAVIVARAGLGTLNHVAMTAAMLQQRHVALAGVVLNAAVRAAADDLAVGTNPAALARMLPGVNILSVPYREGAGAVDAAVPYLTAFHHARSAHP